MRDMGNNLRAIGVATPPKLTDWEFAERYLKGTRVFPEDTAARWFDPSPTHIELANTSQRIHLLLIQLARESAKCHGANYYRTVQDRVPLSVTKEFAVTRDAYTTEEGPAEPIYRVTTRSGRHVEVNRSHPFLTWGETPGEWRTLDQGLVVGDWVAVLRRGEFGAVHDPALAYVVGWMLADANLVSQAVSITDPVEQEDFVASLHAAGLTPGTRRSRYVRVRKMLGLWKDWGLRRARSAEKFVPAWALQGDRETVAALLRGLLKGSWRRTGSSEKARRVIGVVEYTSTSERLASDVQHLLTKFGVYSHLRHETMAYRGKPYRFSRVYFTDVMGLTGDPAVLDGPSVSDRFPPQWRNLLPPSSPPGVRGGTGWRRALGISNSYATTREKVRRTAEYLGHDQLLKLCESPVGWETVTSIEPVGVQPIVSVESIEHTLGIGDVVTHNSTLFSFIKPLRMIVEDRRTRAVIISKKQEKASEFVGAIGNQLQNNERILADYGTFYDEGWLRAHKQSWSSEAITVVRNADFRDPTVQAVGRGGQIVSARNEYVVLDDVEDYGSTRTAPRRQGTYHWFLNDVVPTVVSGGWCIVVQTPQHQSDLVGQLVKHGAWKLIRVPAERDEPDPERPGRTHRVAMWPAKWPVYWTDCEPKKAEERGGTEDAVMAVQSRACPECPVFDTSKGDTGFRRCLTGTRWQVGTTFYTLQYKVDVSALGGEVWRKGWIRYYTRKEIAWRDGRWVYSPADLPGREFVLRLGMGVDPAVADEEELASEEKSEFGLVVVGYAAEIRRRLVLYTYGERIDFPTQQQVIVQQFNAWRPAGIVPEEIGFQRVLRQQLRHDFKGLPFLPRKRQDGDKYRRFTGLTPEFQAGNVYILGEEYQEDRLGNRVPLPNGLKLWEQCISFPRGTHDDLIDAFDLACDIATRSMALDGHAEYLAKVQAAQPQERPVAPPVPTPGMPGGWTVAQTLAYVGR